MTRVYKTFNFPNATKESKTLLTGIIKKDGKYLISGFYEEGDKTVSFLWKGRKLNPKSGKWYVKNFHSQVTNLYGPDFLSENRIQIVGNYFQNGSLGCLYEGCINENQKWTIIVPPFHSNVVNTILHSVRENLVVGNYEIENENNSRAFIYDIETGNYINIVPEYEVKSISAYGIVYSKGIYTICGGYIKGIKSYAYMVDFNRNTNKFSRWKEFSYNNDSNFITHFNGISVDENDIYTLTGDYIEKDETNHFGFFARYKKYNLVNNFLDKGHLILYENFKYQEYLSPQYILDNREYILYFPIEIKLIKMMTHNTNKKLNKWKLECIEKVLLYGWKHYKEFFLRNLKF